MKFEKRDIPKGDGTGGLFLRFKDGDSKVGVFRGEIYELFQKWENGKAHLVEQSDPEAKSRFRLNFVTKEDGEMRVKIFEFGLTIYNQLAEISEDYDVDKTALKITRRGTGTDTVYILIPAKEQPTPAQMKSITALPLNILNHKDAPAKAPVKNHAPGAGDESDIPF